MRAIQAFGCQQIGLGFFEPVQLKVIHPELGVRQRIFRTVAHGTPIERKCVRGRAIFQQFSAQVDQGLERGGVGFE